MNDLIMNNLPWILAVTFLLSCLMSAIAVTGTMPGSRFSTRVEEWFLSAWIIFGYLLLIGMLIWMLATGVNLALNLLEGWL